MSIYDEAHALARSLKETEEYKEYTSLRELVYDDSTNKALLDEYKRLQFKMQAKIASGERVEEESFKRLQQIANILQFNEDCSKYLLSEFRFQRLLSDIYKILGDAAGIDMDSLLSN